MTDQGPQQPGPDPVFDPACEPVYPEAFPAAPYVADPAAPPGYLPTQQLPQYAPPQYSPPQYSPPQYSPPQYGQYAPPQYGAPAWPPPGAPGTPAPPGGPTGPSGRRRGLFAAAGVVVAVVVALVGYVLFSAGSSGAATPAKAVRNVLEAGRTLDTGRLRDSLCAADRRTAGIGVFAATDRLSSYAVGATTSTGNGRASVHATVTTADGSTEDIDLPVVKEDGGWKVCLSSAAGALPGLGHPGAAPSTGRPAPSAAPSTDEPTLSLPTAIPSGLLPSGLPTGLLPSTLPGNLDFCASASDALSPALAYVGAAEIGLGSIAQTCVYRDTVPRSATDRLNGRLLAPDGGDRTGGHDTGPTGVYAFRTLGGGPSVTVTTTRQADGRYYVTAVTIG